MAVDIKELTVFDIGKWLIKADQVDIFYIVGCLEGLGYRVIIKTPEDLDKINQH